MENEQTEENVLPLTKNINLMELFPRILNKEEKDFQITPSEYVKEMSLTMEERYKKSRHAANTMKNTSKSYPPQFKIIPEVLMFQRFELRSTNVLILEVKNIGKVLLPIKMHCPSSDYFSAKFANAPLTRIAPGLSVEYEVTFTPKKMSDYRHFLMFTSKEQSFRVPIIGVGPRPMLDIPDQIVLNPAPVKVSTSKFIVVRNIGNAPAVFNFITQSKHFQVSPAKGILAVQESVVLNISFESSKVKEVTELLHAVLETGERLTITLHGAAENACVRLDKNSLVHEDTPIGLKRCKTVRLINGSASVIKFTWKKNKTQEEDLSIIESLRDKYKELAEIETLKDAKVIYYGLSNAERHKISCERILNDELKLLEKEEFKFAHEEFSIMPESGEVWPKGSAEMMVSFEPKTCGLISTEAYLEVSGKDSRLPLKIKGNGVGPDIVLNVKTLDIDFIYLCSLHKYEVTVENKGDIPGTVEYLPEPLVFGGKAEITPKSNHLEPGHIAAFVISFTSNKMGDFTEKLNFLIKESKERIYLVLKGKVLSPSLHFDVKQINFGVVSFGFPESQEITLNNLSMVPVLFSLKVKPDGETPSISYEQFAKFTVKPALPMSPKEFKMSPEESVVEPFSSKKVTVTLTANKAGRFQKELLVDIWNSESGTTSCPIIYEVLIPKIHSSSETISIPFCFVNFPYTRSITLTNASKVVGFFYIFPTDPNSKSSIKCSVSTPQSMISPQESIKIDVAVITSALGLQVYPLNMLIFGVEAPEQICEITCSGQGPVVIVKPSSLDWGDLPLIQPSQRTLELSNESPIPADLELQMVKQNSPWEVDPHSLSISSGETVAVVVSLTLNDTGKYKDNLKVVIRDGKDLSVPLSGNGVGSSLKIEPNLSPCYDLGMLSSNKLYQYDIVIDNKGVKSYSLVWSPLADFKSFVNAKFVNPQEFEPTKVDIPPGEQATVILQTFSKSAGKLSHPFHCFSRVGNNNSSNYKLFFKFNVHAHFLEPVVCFDKDEIRFWHNVGFNELEAKTNDNVCVINNSFLLIPIELTTTDQFYIETSFGECTQSLELTLNGMEVRPLTLKFLSQPDPDKICRTYKGKLTVVLKNYSKTNTVSLIGEVNYPNVIVRPNNIDFGYIIAGRSYSKMISLINVSPLTVHFSIRWDAASSETTCCCKAPSEELLASEETHEEAEKNSERDREESAEENKRQEEEGIDNSADVRSQQDLNMPEKPVLRMPELQISSTDIRTALFPLARNYFSCDNELMEAYRLASSSKADDDSEINFPKICDIIPFYGQLEPYSCQILTIRFFSKFALSVHLKALINVMSGPTEVITIDAVTTSIDFQINSVELDFGRQLFCETASQILKVKNTSSMSLCYEVNSNPVCKCELNENSEPGRGLMTLCPESGVVNPNQSAEVIVRYHPGLPGKFEDHLELQIAFLEPIRVKVTGVGVFPQVYVTLARPDIFEVSHSISYMAVASITPDWILTKFFQSDKCGFNPVNTCRSQENSQGFPEENEWEILDPHDSIPTEIDIYLAIERAIAYDLLRQENNATFAAYARTIPGFLVPAYTLDFGVCVIGHQYEQQVDVVNFGPLPVILHSVFTSKLKEEGIFVKLRKRNELKIGACLSFAVSFAPKQSKYNKKYEKLDTKFHFEVYHGPKIPIRIVSEISYPYIIASTPALQFCEVVCGCCKIMNLRLHNPGMMTAEWTAFIQQDDMENTPGLNSSQMKCQRTVFQVHQDSGSLSPGDYCTLKVSFKPVLGGCFSGILHIAVDRSLTDSKIVLFGSGIEPRLCISKCVLNFRPSLPFPNKSVLTEKTFTVENPCTFPIEFYFADFDEQINEEDKIIRALTLYYDSNECFIPVRRPGEGLPVEIIDFYNMLLDNLNSKYMEEERGKTFAERERESLEENLPSGFFFEDDSLPEAGQPVERRKKKFRKLSRSRTSLESGRDLTGSIASVRDPVVLTIFETKTAEEIDQMMEVAAFLSSKTAERGVEAFSENDALQQLFFNRYKPLKFTTDYIRSMRNTEPRYDPIEDALKSLSPPPKEKEYKEGTLIIIHGAPYTNSVQLANRVSTFVNLPALNIDRIVLEEAVLRRCDAGYLVKERIEKAYLDQFGVEVKENEKEEEQEEEEGIVQPTFDQSFEEIQRKFNALVELRESSASARGKNIRTGSSKSETPRKTENIKISLKPQMNTNAPIANITENIVIDILRFRLGLEICKGVVIEKLESALIGPCTNALTSVLKAAGNVKDIIVIFFLTNYASYRQLITNKQQEEELANLFQQEILRILEEEPEEVSEALNLSPEQEEFFRGILKLERLEAQAAFERKRDDFYKAQRQKKKDQKQGLQTSALPPKVPGSSTPNKKGKESENISKGTKTSERSYSKSQSEPKSAKNRLDPVEGEFESFEITFAEMKNIIENWDQRIGAMSAESLAQFKTKKGQTPRRVTSTPTVRTDGPRGVFLWLVDVSKPLSQNVLACCNHLKETLREKKSPEERDSWPLECTESTTFSVVSAPQRRLRCPLNQIFSITAVDNVMMGEDYYNDAGESGAVLPLAELNRSVSSISFKSKRKSAGPSKRGRSDSKMSVDWRTKKAVSSARTQEKQFKSRWILQPGELQRYLVRYYPTQIGCWEQHYVLCIVNQPEVNTIRCLGNCDIPRLDLNPEVLFCAVEYRKPLNREFTPAYYYSENAYDFGAVITARLNEEKKGSEKSVSLRLSNISKLPVDLIVIFGENKTTDESNGSEFVKINPEKLRIDPKKCEILTVTVSPTRNGSFLENLLFIIKDNPKVESLQIKFEGAKPKVSVQPELVDFERVLLHRNDYRNVVLINENTLPVYFAFQGIEEFPSHLSFSRKLGCIQPLESTTIEVSYQAVRVEIIDKKPVVVQIFDDEEWRNLVQELTLEIKVEAYDAALDIIFSLPEDDHIDFGDIRMQTNYGNEFSLKNSGKYQLGYQIVIGKMFLKEAEFLSITPMEGKLHPGKLHPITITVRLQHEVSWNRLEFFKIHLVEPSRADEWIAAIPINVSLRSHFVRFELIPSNEYNFGHIVVGTPKTGVLELKNTGFFSLSFFVELLTPLLPSDASGDTMKKSSKFSASSKEKGDKGKKNEGVLKTGSFEISPSVGTIGPGLVMPINITCYPNEVKSYEEKVVFLVKETPPELQNGKQFTISAESCLPFVDFEDYGNIFREHFCYKDESELNDRCKTGTYTIYTINNNLFSFKNICVNKTAEARLHFQNPGSIDCVVTAVVSFQPEEWRSNAALPSDDSHYFSVSPEKHIIEPYNSECFLISFKPDALEVYKVQITFTLTMPEGFDDVVRVYNLWGNGMLPQIEITEPNLKTPEGQILVNFPPVFPGHSCSSSIAFSNVGISDCKVVMELFRFQKGTFTITPKLGSETTLKVWELARPIDHTALVSLAPGQVAEFYVTFTPPEVQNYNAQIKLFVVDNPFENWSFRLNGEAFLEEVVIEKIRTAAPFLTNTDEKALGSISLSQYFITLGDCYVNKKSKVVLRLTNRSEKSYFKFEWEEVASISIFPHVGHLYPNSFKEILVVFYPEEPMELDDITLTCLLSKVIIRNPPEISWDSRLFKNDKNSDNGSYTPRAHEKNSSVTTVRDEPLHEIIPESNMTLYVIMSAVADYARLTCETTKIIFKETFMFQTRIFPLVLINSGNVALEYKLSLKSVTSLPLKDNKSAQVNELSLHHFQPSSRPFSRWSSSTSSQRRCRKRRKSPRGFLVLDLSSSEEESESENPPEEEPPEPNLLNYNPFSIKNPMGRILAKEEATVDILFSPMDINEYNTIITIQVANLHPECELPEIQVTATSLMPYCHFEIPESDYLKSGRRDHNRPGPVGFAPGVPLHPETKTIETKVVGLDVVTPIKFHVINPTEEDYAFSWTNTTQIQPGVVSPFLCSTADGQIQAGRQQLMSFKFVSQTVGIAESFWTFSIPKFGVEAPFLFVGDVREPAVYLLSNHVCMTPTFIGCSTFDAVTLASQEDEPVNFHFIVDSLYSEGRLNILKVEPSWGTIPPHSEFTVRLKFTGKTPGKTLFNAKCKVKNMKNLLNISVEVITFAVQYLLTLENPRKGKLRPDFNDKNLLEFGCEMSTNVPETMRLDITNFAKTPLYYEWEYNLDLLEARHCKLKLSPKSGHVKALEKGSCDISLVFLKKSSLCDFPVMLKFRLGPTINFFVSGVAAAPHWEFSFSCYDFGFCFLQEKDTCFYETSLLISNRDSADLVLECELPESSAFSYTLPSTVIHPCEDLEIPITFHPKDLIYYEEVLKLTINGSIIRNIVLMGRGTDFKVTLADAEDKTISLGAVKEGHTSSRKFSIVNKSLANATLLVGFSDQLPVGGAYLVKPRELHLDLSVYHRLSGIITISPSTVFSIKPQEVQTITVTYSPRDREPPFSETVCLQHHETAEPLCVLTGCCLGAMFWLDRNFLNFGGIIEGCTTCLKLKLINSGDFGARFEWDVQDLTEYTISPACGYSSPQSNVTISVTFHPTRVQNCIKDSVLCHLILSESERYAPLYVNLIGDCVALPEPEDIVWFECFVRSNDTKTVEIQNTSGSEWQLMPVITGEYFKGLETLIIPPLSSASYQIEYSPMMMADNEDVHQGTVFFKLPNGRGIVYMMKGVALPPEPEETIDREVPCKTKYVELLKVKNWLPYPQRFKVDIICVDNKCEAATFCTGFEYLEVLGLAQKEYCLNFFAYNTGYYKYNVKFSNEETKEYVWYVIAFNVVMCGPLEVITLRSGVRQTCYHELRLENPLKKTVEYELETTTPEIYFDSPAYEVPPEQSMYVILSFTPIHPGEKNEKLTASCPELGVFPRELRLFAAEVLPEPPRMFQTPLGSSLVQDFSIENLSWENAVLHCKIDSEDFTVIEQTTIPEGETKKLSVTYEPSEMGSTAATLLVESKEAGKFIFPLVGMCVKPLAKGPFILKPGSGANVNFKNVFRKPKEFHFYVDNPAFVLKTSQETLSPKEECKIFVGMQRMKDLEKEYGEEDMKPSIPVAGQLVIECFNPYVRWQYYLKGILDT